MYTLAKGIKSNLDIFGFKNRMAVDLSFRNHDTIFADESYKEDPEVIIPPFVICDTRPDGTKIESSMPSEKRNVLAFSKIYFYHDSTVFPDGKTTQNPTGFYLVLWEDGEVTKVPHDKVRFVHPQRTGSYAECFPGQEGIPANMYTNAERWKKAKPLRPNGTNPNVLPVLK